MRGLALAGALVLSASSCLGVPSVDFAEDAAADVSDAARDSQTSRDGSVDAPAGPDAVPGCPASPPPGASWCCGPVPCRGDAGACSAECTNCENDCAEEACCLDEHGNFQGCAKTPIECPH